MLIFIEFTKELVEELVDFLSTEHWPYHGQPNPSKETIRSSFEKGFYTENGNKTFWILDKDEKIGMIRLFDLEDPTCLFDIRLKKSFRGKKNGMPSVKWISDYVFTSYPHIIRVEGHTRFDNYAMRKTLYNCRFVKEAYHRNAWPQDGKLFDSVGYAMTRNDWKDNTVTRIEDPFNF
ncbi:MAG TPA: GNAT family protein [Pseudoneobacillus sp.]|nr:GNAT family protein [Pseudoneobacillus sp.]